MKSRTSCFNRAIAKNLLRRFWPLWLAYFLLLLLVPLSLLNSLRSFRPEVNMTPGLNFQLAGFCEPMFFVSFFAGLLAAMAAFGFLYNSRSCGLMTSLPVTRSCLFVTCFFTGILPLLAADLIVAFLTALFCYGGYLEGSTLVTAFAMLMLSKLFFYGFAVFCAMLTGNVLAFPLIYFLLNFAVVVAEETVRELLAMILYGMPSGGSKLSFLSPLVYMVHQYTVMYVEWPERVKILGLETVAVYAAVGLVLAGLAWRLFLRRRMETAGDTVAIRALKPIFIFCMTFGSAAVVAAALCAVLNFSLVGRPAAMVLLLMMLFGAVLGYFAANMIVDKSLCVFRGHGKGCLVSLAILVLTVGACEMDVFGFETWVPEADEVESVSFGDVYGLHKPESIADVLELHRSLIANKAFHESAANSHGEYLAVSDEGALVSRNLYLTYHLKNGKTVMRGYRVLGGKPEMADPDSDISRMEEIYNIPESRDLRCSTVYAMRPENVAQASLHVDRIDSNGEVTQDNIRLSPEELIDLWENAVLPDVAEGHFGHCTLFESERDWQRVNVGLSFMLVEDAETFWRQGGDSGQMEWHDYQITTDSVHTLEWIREHTGLEPEPTILNMFGAG